MSKLRLGWWMSACLGVAVLVAASSASARLPSAFETKSRKILDSYALQSWDTADGMPMAAVFALKESRDGYLWIGTSTGLVRFDGTRFRTFDRTNVPEFQKDRVGVVWEDHGGTLYLTIRQDGLFRYSEGSWTRVLDFVEQGIGLVAAASETPDGVLWLVDRQTLWRIDDGAARPIEELDASCTDLKVSGMDVGPDGGFWLGDRQAVFQYRDGRCEKAFDHSLAPGPGERVLVEASRDGGVWLASENRLHRHAADHGLLGQLELPGDTIALLEDSEGDLWIGTERGLFLYRQGDSLESTVLRSLGVDDGLLDNRFRALLEGRDGSVWLGTYGGLQRLRVGRIRTLSSTQGLRSDFVLTVQPLADGSLLIGHVDGVDRYADGIVEPVPFSDSDPLADSEKAGRAFLEDSQGRVWTATGRGLYQLDSEPRRWVKRLGAHGGQGPLSLFSLFEADDGTLWLGAEKGALQVGRELQVLKAQDIGAAVHTFHQDEVGDLWLGTGSGLYRLRDGSLDAFSPSDRGQVTVRSIYEDADGILWLGTLDLGLLRFDGERFLSFDRHRGLPDNNVWRALDDRRGQLFMCSDLGVFSVDFEELRRAVETGDSVSSRLYGLEDGLKDVECNGGFSPSAFRDEANRLWFPTAGGVAVIETGPPEPAVPLFPPIIEAVSVDERAVPFKNGVNLSSEARTLEISFTSPSFDHPERLQLSYRLKGFDVDWRRARVDRTAVYPRLSPGKYRFEVTVAGSDGLPRPEIAELAIEVPTPWWQSSLAFILYALAVVTGSALFVRSQARKIEEQKEIVERQTLLISSLLPICAHCKSIKDDDGTWKILEDYVDARSSVRFSHGICPSCMEKHYPDVGGAE